MNLENLKQPACLVSERLTLVAATARHVRAELKAPDQLAMLLDAVVSPSWPPGEYDREAMSFFLARFEEGGAAVEGWYSWYALVTESERRVLVGAGGYFGPPDEQGSVEIGYSILPEWQGQGYATELAGGLVEHVLSFPRTTQVVAHTFESNPASVRVLERCGFRNVGPGSEPGLVRFVRPR